MFITPCPVSYLEVQLGRRNQQFDVLVGPVDFPIVDDAIYALQLQMDELNGRGQGGRLNRVPVNSSHAVSGFAGGGNPWVSGQQRGDSSESDDGDELQEGQGGRLNSVSINMPQQRCDGSGGAGARSNRVSFYPRQHGRHGFWRHIPSAAPQFNRLLLCCMGAGLCTLGVYLAFSSFFTGAAIIAGGLLCLLASTLNSNHNPAPVEPSRDSARL